jgi:hypothetical protein
MSKRTFITADLCRPPDGDSWRQAAGLMALIQRRLGGVGLTLHALSGRRGPPGQALRVVAQLADATMQAEQRLRALADTPKAALRRGRRSA